MTMKPTHNRLPRLGELATAKLLAVLLLVEDIGDCPFHIARPILARMSAKQLAAIETCCSLITPELDCLWLPLIEKDFPNRPSSHPHTTRNWRAPTPMPNKSLYHQYSADRAALQKDSTERLRRVTERIHLQKAANKVVAVAQHLQDPTVRRRHGDYGSRRSPLFLKAQRELQERMVMFRGQRGLSKFHSPVSAISVKQVVTPSRAPSITSPTTPSTTCPRNLTIVSPKKLIMASPKNSAKSPRNTTKPRRDLDPITPENLKISEISATDHRLPSISSPTTPSNVISGQPPVITDRESKEREFLQRSDHLLGGPDNYVVRSADDAPVPCAYPPQQPPPPVSRMRKRKPQSSVFLNPKRRQLPPLKPSPRIHASPVLKRQDESPTAPSRIKAIRSSIFS